MDFAEAYERLHSRLKFFPGYSIQPHVPAIAALIAKHQPSSLLDYGCGKGYQYLKRRVHETWGGLLPHCYDIGVPHLNEKPTRRFDGVICTDMLEHVPEADVPLVIDEICNYADKFVFCSIDTAPAIEKHQKKNPGDPKGKRLPDGRNLHVTVRPREWWEPHFAKHRGRIEVVTAYEP